MYHDKYHESKGKNHGFLKYFRGQGKMIDKPLTPEESGAQAKIESVVLGAKAVCF
jgi:hypothetical protein